jgi:hypothetical protein
LGSPRSKGPRRSLIESGKIEKTRVFRQLFSGIQDGAQIKWGVDGFVLEVVNPNGMTLDRKCPNWFELVTRC